MGTAARVLRRALRHLIQSCIRFVTSESPAFALDCDVDLSQVVAIPLICNTQPANEWAPGTPVSSSPDINNSVQYPSAEMLATRPGPIGLRLVLPPVVEKAATITPIKS